MAQLDPPSVETTLAERQKEWLKEELNVLLDDWAERHKEIRIRSRAENYNFVLVVTGLAAVAGLFAAFRDQATSLPQSAPLLAAIGALLLSILPVNLAHLATSTELRRHYIEVILQPRIRDLVRDQTGAASTTGPLLTFEEFDRAEHKGKYNALLVARAAFSLVPSLALSVISLVLVAPEASSHFLEFGLIGLAVAASVVAIVALSSMWRRTKRLRSTHPSTDALEPRWKNPKQRVKDRKKDSSGLDHAAV